MRRAGRRYTVTLSGEARSGYPEAVPVARVRLGDGLGAPELYLERPDGFNGRLPAYARLDASAEVAFTFLDARWKAMLQVYNLAAYQNVIGRVYTPTATGVTVRDRRGLPLIPLLELSVVL